MTLRSVPVLALVLVAGCDIRFTMPSITNTNTNDNRISIDSHDVFNFNPTFPAPGTTTPNPVNPGAPETPLPIPSDAQAIASAVAAAKQFELLHSCQDRDGVMAWNFMDAIVAALKARDLRWGYLCKNGDCNNISRDVIAYRATDDNIGVWGVDIIGSHCAVPPAVSTFTWNVIGFDPVAVWKATRQ
jgi:hypothetical protein